MICGGLTPDVGSREEDIIDNHMATLPIVDISPFVDESKKSDEAARKRTAEAIHQACKEVGFFYITNHGVDADLVEGVLTQAREFFLGQPLEEKEKISIYKHGVRCASVFLFAWCISFSPYAWCAEATSTWART